MRITDFLEPFFSDEAEPLWIWGYSPKELDEKDKLSAARICTTRRDLRTNLELQNKLRAINKKQGIYFTVNSGGTKKEEINKINAVFCEIDDLPIEEQHEIFDNCDYPPSIRVETKKSVHAYWLPSEPLTIDSWLNVQNGLIKNFKSDKALKNQNRVMRVPFFNHVSIVNGEWFFKLVTIHTFNDTRYSLEELQGAFPYIEPKIETVNFENYGTSPDWSRLFDELRHRIQSMSSYHVERCGKLASAQGICHNGETNRTLVLCLQSGKVFCRNGCTFDEILRAFGIEKPKGRQIIYKPRRQQSSELYRWFKAQQRV